MFRINLNITFSYIPKLLQWCKFSLINQVYVLSVYLRIVIDILRQAYYTASSFVCCLRYHSRPTYIRTAFIILLYIVNRYSGICCMKITSQEAEIARHVSDAQGLIRDLWTASLSFLGKFCVRLAGSSSGWCFINQFQYLLILRSAYTYSHTWKTLVREI